MTKFLRYALATFCFAASVGCLALWARSENSHLWMLGGRGYRGEARVDVFGGYMFVFARPERAALPPLELNWVTGAQPRDQVANSNLQKCLLQSGRFGVVDDSHSLYFPLWYASLVFALAGVASLRLGRRFTLRSTIIATTVVAGLLGMVVAL
jgi:hypothetical protein